MSEAWAERAAERSPSVRRSRARSLQQARLIVEAARRLIDEKGENFTTQELVKEAGVALQTFYRYFGSKDELLLAVIEDLIAEAAVQWREQARAVDDPVERLRSYVTSALATLTAADQDRPANPRFVASEHWRLSAMFPDEIALATKPVTDLVAADIKDANARGLLHSVDPDRDAWFVTQFVMSVFHQQSFAPTSDPDIPVDLWRLILGALGGHPS
jgi:AcrR family transcriptional regulator